MECYQCEKPINLNDKTSYQPDYIGEVWCNKCMEEEIQFAKQVNDGTIIL